MRKLPSKREQTSGIGLIARIYKELKRLNTLENSISKWTNALDSSQKEKYNYPVNTFKMFNIFNYQGSSNKIEIPSYLSNFPIGEAVGKE